jgi:hypothetical protein
MLSRNSLEPDDPKFAHEVAAGIIARARAKLSINSGSSDGDRIRIDAAKSASGFVSKLETVSSLLLATSTPSSSADSKFKPEIERIKFKAAQLRNKTQIRAKQPADERNLQSPAKHSLLKKDGKNDNVCLNEIEMKRLAMSELTKIPVKILEKRLHGLSDRLEGHLSPERRSSPSSRGATPTFNQLSPKSGNVSPKSRSLAYSPQSSNRCGAVPCTDLKALNQNWVGGGPAACAAVMMAIAFCSRINNLYVSACARREHAARKIQRAYLIHLFRHFYGRSRKKRSAFIVLVRSLRKYVRRWRIRKRSRCVHFIRQFLTSVKLRRKFVCAVKHKFKMVCAFANSHIVFLFLMFHL